MTAARRHYQPQPHLAVDTYDPDEVIPRDSPLMKALRPKLELSPSPSLEIPPEKIHPSSGDAVLVSYLDNGRRPEIARAAGALALPGVEEDEDEDRFLPIAVCPSRPLCLRDSARSRATMTTPILQHMAADALQAVAAESPLNPPLTEMPDISASTRQLSISDERPTSVCSYLASGQLTEPLAQRRVEAKLPGQKRTPAGGELPPLQMDFHNPDLNGQNLPSIRSTFGDFRHITSDLGTSGGKELTVLNVTAPIYPRSPSCSRPLLPPMAAPHASPPISPSEAYTRSFPSPHSLSTSSHYSYYQANASRNRQRTESNVSATIETPFTDNSVSTIATSTSVADRMSIDGITNPQVGVYICKFSGCTAPPFQTQYLLNSHANVHSSVRPHYCSVKGCPRSEGGKGFKRKNEMIRHGLVHDSPGYVCPFCPDREHKYPRPDNLQRHVRVHHVDKDKDDPMLREVLSQRPDGPNRGRRRRGVAA